jgi:hypothetical protein
MADEARPHFGDDLDRAWDKITSALMQTMKPLPAD